MRILNQAKGFTLLELMTVVLIMGVLTSISLPLFKEYQVKARATEGKLILSSVYLAEKSWYAQFDVYSSCLTVMGIEKPAQHFFSFGFTTKNSITSNSNINQLAVDNGAPQACGLITNADTNAYFYQGTKTADPTNVQAPDIATLGAGIFGVTDNAQSFIAVSAGYIGSELSLTYVPGLISSSIMSSAYARNDGERDDEGDDGREKNISYLMAIFGMDHLKNFYVINSASKYLNVASIESDNNLKDSGPKSADGDSADRGSAAALSVGSTPPNETESGAPLGYTPPMGMVDLSDIPALETEGETAHNEVNIETDSGELNFNSPSIPAAPPGGSVPSANNR
jgi:prepilin-type N-terminal cleavage/methylation domain-containing protein